MFIPIEALLLFLLTCLFTAKVIIPAFRPLFNKSYEDKKLNDAKQKDRKAQKLLMAAELEAKALETEVRADEVIEHALSDRIK